MAVLASVADYEVLTGLTVGAGAETTRVNSLLVMASDAVLASAAGQQIVSGAVTETVRPFEGVGRLAQRPVSAVTTVTLAGVTLTAGTDYRFTAGGNARHALLIRRVNGNDSYWADCDELTVLYTAGWAVVPGPVKAMVVGMVRGAMTTGVDRLPTTESVGSYSVGFGDTEERTGFSLSDADAQVLRLLVGVRGPSHVTVRPG